MITLLCALALQQQQTITFTHPCAHSSVVLEKLGEQAGLVLKPSGSVNKDYIVVSFHDVPIKTALDKIATTLNARWIEKNGVRYLERTPAQETQDFEQEYNERVAAIKKALAKTATSSLTTGEAEILAAKVRDFGDKNTPEKWVAYQKLASELPAHKAMAAIVQLLDIDWLVRGTREVSYFSNRESDQPLPKGSDKIFESLAKEWVVYAEAASRVGLSSADTYQKFSGQVQGLRENARLGVEVFPDRFRLHLTYLANNTWNNLAYLDIPYFEGVEVPSWVQELEGDCVRTVAAHESVQPTALREVRASFRDILLHDLDRDAILAAPGELVQQLAGESSLVAVLPDSSYLKMATTEGLKPGRLSVTLATQIEQGLLTVERGANWVIVMPHRPYTARLERMDRAAFRKMALLAESKDSLDLDTFADFVATTTEDTTVEATSHAMGRAFALETGFPSSGLDAIRLYGLLNSVERQRTRSEPVAISGRTDFERFAIPLSKESRTFVEIGAAPTNVQRRPGGEREVAAASIPRVMEFAIQTSDTEFIQPYITESLVGGWLIPMDPDTFAINRALSRRPGAKSNYDFSLVAAVPGAMVNLRFHRTDKSGGGTAFGRFVDPIAKPKFGPYEQLSATLKQAVEKAEKSLPAWANGGGGR